MAFRRPLYETGGNLREMSDLQIGALATRAAREYLSSPSVSLSVVSSGGNLGTISDTRLQAGSATSDSTNFDTAAETPNISTVTVNYARINQSVTNTDFPGLSMGRFLYYTDGGDIREMSDQDMYDTIGDPAIDQILSGADALYTIRNTTTLSFYDRVSSTPVFSDTRANVAAYTASGIPETRDQPTTINNYYLFKAQSSSYSIVSPVYLRSSDNRLQTYTETTAATLMREMIRHMAAEVSGRRIRFSWNGSGTNTGTVVNTKLNGSGNYQTLQVDDDYRSQEFPNGSVVTANTYNLRVRIE